MKQADLFNHKTTMLITQIHSIMIVDDDADDIELFCETLFDINPGIHCLTAKNGQEALLALKKKDFLPDLIFMDLNMPRMTGKQCLAEIKKSELLHTIAVIIYTTSKIKDDIQETRQPGAFDFITKPYRIADTNKLC